MDVKNLLSGIKHIKNKYMIISDKTLETIYGIIITLILLTQVVFIILKLINYIIWSWWLVMSPLFLIVTFIIGLLAWLGYSFLNIKFMQ